MNREDNYYYNGSGYADPVAAAVINKIEKEMKNMTTLPKPFEIWRISDYTSVVIIATHDSNVQYVKLFDYATHKAGELQIGNQFINLRYLAYGYADRGLDFVRALKKNEILDIKNAICSIFDIGLNSSGKLDQRESEIYELKKMTAELELKLSDANAIIDGYKTAPRDNDITTLQEKIKSQQVIIDLLAKKIAKDGCEI